MIPFISRNSNFYLNLNRLFPFSGWLRTLTSEIPSPLCLTHLTLRESAIDLGFRALRHKALIALILKEPHFDFGLKLLGTDLMSIPGLYKFVQETIKDQVANMHLWPKTLEVQILDQSKYVDRIGELEDIIRRKNMIIRKLNKDILILEQKESI